MALDRELATYEQYRAEWLATGKEGQWVLIHLEDVSGIFPDLEAAVAAGYERFGLNELFMVRQIAREHRPVHASRRAIHADSQPGN